MEGRLRADASVGGKPRDVPRGSGTGLAAWYAGFVDRSLAIELTSALLAHERTFFGFGGVAEFGEQAGHGDIDSGPVVLGVSVTRLFRTTTLFGMPTRRGEALCFRTGGPIGNALLLAMLTSGPEVVR